MFANWKVIIAVLLLTTIGIDGNRARRRRRQVGLNGGPNSAANNLNRQGQVPPQQNEQNGPISGKQGGRQYYPYQGQYGYGTVQNLNYPYAGSGLGNYQYGYGSYGQYGQGGNQYGAYYNQYPGSSSFYGGYNSAGNNPSYYGTNTGYGGYGNYYWNAGEKRKTNMFAVCLSSLLTVAICWFTI